MRNFLMTRTVKTKTTRKKRNNLVDVRLKVKQNVKALDVPDVTKMNFN
jgi:hypothetical protein